MSGALLTAFQLSFQISPIILVDGLANDIPGNMLPVVALTEAVGIVNGALNGALPDSLDDYFAQFVPMPGGNIIANEYGQYPFANQQVASNAVIFQPLNISLMMISPNRGAGDYLTKLATFTALRLAIDQHIALGGSFTVVTPAYIYQNCLLLDITDVTDQGSRQKQMMWQWNFWQPLITLAEAQSAYNGLMTNINNGAQVTGNPPSYSGAATAVGNPVSGATPAALTGTVAPYQSATPVAVSISPLT